MREKTMVGMKVAKNVKANQSNKTKKEEKAKNAKKEKAKNAKNATKIFIGKKEEKAKQKLREDLEDVQRHILYVEEVATRVKNMVGKIISKLPDDFLLLLED